MKISAMATFRPIFFSFFILFNARILQHCNAAPVAPQDTETPAQCACNIAPDATIIHDASCMQEDLREYASSVGSQYINNGANLRCDSEPFSLNSQPIHILSALAGRVDALSLIQESAINTSYSDYICRLKESIIPHLNETLHSICGCSDESCDMNVPLDILNSEDGLDYGNEYCLLNNIQSSLGNLLIRITRDKHLKASVSAQCLANLDTRYRLGKLRSDIDEAEKDLRSNIICPRLGDASSLAPGCSLYLSGLNELLPTLTGNGQESLAQQLKLVLPTMAELYERDNRICPLPALPSNLNEYCGVSFLKTFYFTAYNYIEVLLQARNVVLQYTPCPAPEDMAAFQEVNGDATTAPTMPRFIINPPSESIPNRPTRH